MLQPPSDELMSSDRSDAFELLKAWAGTTLAFAVSMVGIDRLLTGLFLEGLLTAGLVAGVGFVLHELAHRIVARSYGAEAHFVANNQLLLMSLGVSLLGLFIAAPGAVWHRGWLTRTQGGLIALAGPVTNLVLSVLFTAVFVVLSLSVPTATGWILTICLQGAAFNAWLGLFNMIPAGPFDGAKVMAWSKPIFAVTVAAGLVLTFGLDAILIRDLVRVLING